MLLTYSPVLTLNDFYSFSLQNYSPSMMKFYNIELEECTKDFENSSNYFQTLLHVVGISVKLRQLM